MAGAEKEGWSYVIGATKWHYMVGKMSLCGRWLLLFATGEDYEQGKDNSPDNCVACRRALEKRRKKEGT